MNLQYLEAQTFKECFLLNEEHVKQLFLQEISAMPYFQSIQSIHFKDNVDMLSYQSKVTQLLIDEQYETLAMTGLNRGKVAAQSGLPMEAIADLMVAFRQTYWVFVQFYYSHLAWERRDYFLLEKKVNTAFDLYIRRFYAGYSQYKEEILESQRQMVESMSMPIIPITEKMAVFPIIGALDIHRATKLEESVMVQVHENRLERVLIDLSGAVLTESEAGRYLLSIIEGIKLLGCETILTGTRHDLAQMLVEIGIEFEQVEIYGTLQQALDVHYQTAGRQLEE